MRLSSASTWDAGKPIGYPKEVEPRSGQNMAQMGACQAHVAAPAKPLNLTGAQRQAALSLPSFTWSGGADSYPLPTIARTVPPALSLNFCSMGCWEPVAGFEPMTRCLGGSRSARVYCPPRCAGVHARRMSPRSPTRCGFRMVPVIQSGSPSWLSKIEKGHSRLEEWPLQIRLNSGFVLVSPEGLEPSTR